MLQKIKGEMNHPIPDCKETFSEIHSKLMVNIHEINMIMCLNCSIEYYKELAEKEGY